MNVTATTAGARPAANNRATDLALIASFAALIVVFGFIAIPIGSAGVPLVIQNSIIILTALILGPRRGGLAVGLFLAVGLVLPVLAGGRTVLAALAGPTAGYIVGYLVGAIIAGAIAYRALPRRQLNQVLWFSLAVVAALITQWTFGAIGLILRSGMRISEAFAAQLPFIIPGLVENVFMVLLALGVHAAIPSLLSKTSTTED